jgi:hypothetical protein
MPENLANASAILLFGREIDDIKIAPSGGGTGLPHAGPSHILATQVAQANSRLARIYAFAFEGYYFELSRPAVFLVHGAGAPVAKTVELTGLAATARDFATDLLVWAYDKGDMSVRLDISTGTLEQILVEAEANPEVQFAGQAARVRFAGQAARMQFAGQAARLRGNRSSDD